MLHPPQLVSVRCELLGFVEEPVACGHDVVRQERRLLDRVEDAAVYVLLADLVVQQVKESTFKVSSASMTASLPATSRSTSR